MMRIFSSHRVLIAVLCVALTWFATEAGAEVRNPQGVAVIVGNRDYRHPDIPAVSFAHRDADAFKRYALDVLGFDLKNIIDLRDATRAQLLRTFGRKQKRASDLWAKLLPNREWDVVVFYSGHGVPGLNDGKGYLLPVDVTPRAAQEEGYPIDLLYEKLGNLKNARSVQVYLEACFSGASAGGQLVRSASPVVVRPALPKGLAGKVTAVSASGADQIASWDVKARHGLFTHHLLEALYGKGDTDGDNRVTAKEGQSLSGWVHDARSVAAAPKGTGRERRERAGDGARFRTAGRVPETAVSGRRNEDRKERREKSREGCEARRRGERSRSGQGEEGSGATRSSVAGSLQGFYGRCFRSQDEWGHPLLAEGEGLWRDGEVDQRAGGCARCGG